MAMPCQRCARRSAEIQSETSRTEQLRWMWGATVATQHLWDDEGWKRLAELHLRLVRETGALSELPIALSHQGQMHVLAGELALAASVQEALREATELTRSPLAPYHGVSLAAMRGREVEALQLIRHCSCRADRARRGGRSVVCRQSRIRSLQRARPLR